MTTNIRINSDRLWQSLMDLAKIGATEKGGVKRLALTDPCQAPLRTAAPGEWWSMIPEIYHLD